MCGIAGFIDPNRSAEMRRDAVARMCAHMVHRGPDDEGIETRGPATLGMRRLAIFDPAKGHQPMVSADGRLRIVFNGAIYNFRELRKELAALGHSFRTECDTEVLLAAYAQWGERCLPRLRGMFAFAVWDASDETLFLARDPFGIKPLYYRHDGAQLLFASELNALLASGHVSSEIDPAGIADYLGWFAVPAPRTIYRHVVSLRPGETARFRHGQLALQTAWSFNSIPAAHVCTSREEFQHELRQRLEDTIRAHVIADVPVGAFLSGGLDSAAIVGLMTHVTGARLKTFSIGFAEAGHDESVDAAATARHIGTDHQTRILTGAEVAGALPRLLAAYDQPTGDGINTYFVSETARAGGVTVALSGLGGDELFGGYPSFKDLPRLTRWLPWWRAAPRTLRTRVIAALRRRGTRGRKLADLLEHARNLPEACALQRRVFTESRRRALLALDLRSKLDARRPHHPELEPLSADLAGTGNFETISAWELHTYMADVLLRDSDVMSMRHSLELRVPFVDRPLIEWLWRQPSRFKDDRVQPKSALASAVRDLLPPDLQSRKKRGFILPFATWMRGDLRAFLDETFSDSSVTRSGFFARDAVQQSWRNYLSNRDDRDWSRVWSLAVLIDFTNRRSTTAAPASPPVTTIAAATGSAPTGSARPIPGRTLLLTPSIFAAEGGIPRILQSYLKALCELATNADSIRLVALNDDMIDSRDLRTCANERLTEWRVCKGRKTRFVRDALSFSRKVDRIVCGHVAQLPVALAAKVLNPRIRYYLVAHGIEVWGRFSLLERLALRGATRIFCVSDFTRRELLRGCPLPEGRAVVLHNALDSSFRIAPGSSSPTGAPVILAVTRLAREERYKGVEHLIQAMPAVRAAFPSVRLHIIGRGDDLPRLQAMSDRLELKGTVEFLGFVEDRRMENELRSCSLFALPSSREGFGLVFVEAMACGRPCLGARAGGVPEVISEETGVLVEFGNVPAIAAGCITALRRSWDEPAILARAGEFSYSRFKAGLASLLDQDPSLSLR